MASLHPRPKNIYSDEASGQDMDPKLVIEELLKDFGEPGTYTYSPVEQVFIGVLPTYYPSSPVPEETNRVYYRCKDCGDKFIVESSLKLHKARVTVTIEYNCAECSQRLTFHNRCNFLSHLRQHNFDPSEKDFSSVGFSLLPPPPREDDCSRGGNRGRSDDEQNSNCSSSSSGFASEGRGPDPAPPTMEGECPECQVHLSLGLSEHFRGDDKPGNPRLDCRLCGLLLPTRCCLSAHVRIHTKKRPFICPECCAYFGAWLPFWTHVSKVCCHMNRAVRYGCHICRRLFDKTSSLHKHISLEHTGSDVFVCQRCDSDYLSTEFPDKEKLKQHYEQAHNIKNPKKLGLPLDPSKFCQLCGETVFKRRYVDHIIRHCNVSRCYAYECQKCKEAYTSIDEYVQHGDKGCYKNLETEPTESMVQIPHKHKSHLTNSPSTPRSIGLLKNHSQNTDVKSLENNVDNVEETTTSTDPLLVGKTTDSSGKIRVQVANKQSNGMIKNGSVSSDLGLCLKTKVTVCKKSAPLEFRSFRCKQCNVSIDLSNDGLQKHLAMKHKNSKNIVFEPSRRMSLVEVMSDDLRTMSLENSRKSPNSTAVTERVRTPRKKQSSPRFHHLKNKRKIDVVENDSDDDDYEPPKKESAQGKRKQTLSRRKPKACLGSSTTEDSLYKRIREEKTTKKRGVRPSGDATVANGNVMPRARKQFQSKIARKVSVPFSCPKCPFLGENVETFKEHIKGHRTPNDFQCMECGMCFVTKPSFNIHLIMIHKIKDVDVYIANNDCCNLEVVQKEIATPVLSVREEEIPTVLIENQCSICRKVCDSALNLSNHFRTHGMAYLLWKKKQGHTVDADT